MQKYKVHKFTNYSTKKPILRDLELTDKALVDLFASRVFHVKDHSHECTPGKYQGKDLE